jgi:gliding motility-associated-like protein
MAFNSKQTITIQMAIKLNSYLIFDGSGIFNFNESLYTRKEIIVKQGEINANGFQISSSSIIKEGNSASKINLENAEVNVRDWDMSNKSNLELLTANSRIYVPNIKKDFTPGNYSYNLVGASASKAIGTITVTITDALCSPGTDPVAGDPKEKGTLNVQVDPAGNYYITVFSQADGLQKASGFGNNLDFTLPIGTYLVQVSETGYNQNFATAGDKTIGYPPAFSVAINVENDVSCFGGSDLQLRADATGGTNPIVSYEWENNSANEGVIFYTGQITNADLGEGYYIVYANDANGCQASNYFEYYPSFPNFDDYTTGPNQIQVSGIITTASCASGATGLIDVGTTTGGTPDMGMYPTTGYGYYASTNGAYNPVPGDFTDGNVLTGLAAGTYYLWIIDGNACIEEHNSTISVASVPAPTADAGTDAEVCDGNSFGLSGASATNADTYLWTITAGGTGNFSPSNTALNPTFNPTGGVGTYTLQLQASQSSGACPPATNSMDLNVIPNPVVNAGTDADICGSSYTIADATSDGATHLWTVVAGNAANVSFTPNNTVVNPQIDVSAFGTYTLQLESTNGTLVSCSSSATVDLTFVDNPTADAGTDAEVCTGNTYTLTGASATNADTYLWSITEGGTGTFSPSNSVLNPTFTPTGGVGTYTLQLQTSQSSGTCPPATNSMDLSVLAIPVVDAGNDMTTCGTSYTIADASSDGTTHLWTVVAGNAANVSFTPNNTVVNPQIDVTAFGTYTLQLESTNGTLVSCSSNATIDLTFVDNPTADAGTDAEVCDGDTYDLSGAGATNADTYLWTITAGGTGTFSPSNTALNPTFTPTGGVGTYTLQLRASQSAGTCPPVTNSMNLDVIPLPVVNAGADADICGTTYNIADASSDGTTHLWTVVVGNAANVSFTPNNTVVNPQIDVTAFGTYTLQLESSNGTSVSCSSSATVDLTFVDNPTADAGSDAEVCDGDTYNLSGAGATNADTYLWTITAGGTGTFSPNNTVLNPTFTPTAGVGTYTLQLQSSQSSATCPPATNSMDLEVIANPVVNAGANADVCGTTYTVADASSTGTSHVWSVVVGNAANVTFSPSNTVVNPQIDVTGFGTYTLQLESSNGTLVTCSSSASVTIDFHESPSVNAGVDNTVCYDAIDYELIDATAFNYTAISWKNMTTGDATGFDDAFVLNPTYTFSAADKVQGYVDLVLTASSLHCSDVSDTIRVNISPEMVVSIGSVSPYLIGASTQINVAFWGEHENIGQLGFYLVAPDGTTKIRLYQHNLDGSACIFPIDQQFDSLAFSTASATNLDFCSYNTAPVISGSFDAAEDWSNLYTMDPAQGGWSLMIKDRTTGKTGTLSRATISFTDLNVQGIMQTIFYDSKVLSPASPIIDKDSTIYYVPMGLRTTCNGACDARAIVSVIGGTPPYVSYEWSTGDTGTEVDLCGGDHTVTVTDANGCTAVAMVEVLEPDPIELAVDSTNIACFGGANGMVKVTPSNGVPPYNYLWDDASASTTAQVNGLPAGTYTVTVTDQNLCATIRSITLSEPTSALDLTYVVDPTGCNTSTGTITLTPNGGTPFTVGDAYTYTWAHDALLSANIATGLGVGSYNVLIQDSLGCTLDTTITMMDNGDMEITGFTLLSNVSCAGGCDAEVQVDFTGGTGDYTFNWSGAGLSGTNVSLPNVCGDSTYYVTVTDVNTSCSTSDFFKIPQPDSLKVNMVSQSDVLCFGDSTGTAEAIGIGGTGVYSYAWFTTTNDTLSRTATANDLPYGKIYIEIIDANLCSVIDSIFINQPTELTATTASTNTSCGVATGTALVTPAGGTAPYTYLWDDATNATTALVGDLPSGIYNVTVTDFNGCELHESVTLIDDSDMIITIDNVVDVLCAGDASGAISISVTDALEPIDYIWSNGATTEDITDLVAGTYRVTVTDANLCSRVAEVEITEPAFLSASVTIVNQPLCFGAPSGEAMVVPQGGVAPYSYLWSDGQTTATATNLMAGAYEVSLTDFNGCETTATVTLVDPDAITFDFEFTRTACGDSVGTMNVANLAGGTGAGTYTVSWASPDWASYPAPDSLNTESISNLWVASYVAIVTDANGCEFRDSMNLTDNSNLTIIVDSMAMVSCNGGNNGAILVSALNGTEPYTYQWDSGDTDSLLNDAVAGIYHLRVTDVNLCRRDTAFVITEPDALDNTFVFTQAIICHGDTEASFYAEISGGVAPYTYLWENSAGDNLGQTAALENVTADWYFLTVVDANDCIYEDSIEIVEPDTLVLSISITETQCTDSIGIATATVTGGVAPYTYNWYQLSNPATALSGQGTNTLTDLWVDVFVLEVSDALGCMAIDTFEMNDVSDIDFTLVLHNQVSCVDKCDARAEVVLPTGGTQFPTGFGYNVIWSNGETTPEAESLCLGDNLVRIFDANGCQAVKTVTITDEEALKVNISYFNDISQGGDDCNGSAGAIVTGGTAPYTYLWSTPDNNTSDKIFDLCEGWYYVTVTDASADPVCEVIDSVFIEDDPLRYDTLLLQHISCYGDNSGVIAVQGMGGYPDGYKYFWANENWDSYPAHDSTGNSITNLVAGIYYLTITNRTELDSLVVSIEITQPEPFIPDYTISPTNCSDSSGVISVNLALIQGGTAPFTFVWAHESWSSYPAADSTGFTLSNLWVDDYYVTITDASGCTYLDTVSMEDNSPFVIDPILSQIRCFDWTNGGIDVNPSNGIEPYNFAWDSGQTTQEITGLGAGLYMVTVTDDDGCVRSKTIELTQPDSITFTLKDTLPLLCYTDCDGGITIDNIQGGNAGVWSYIIRESGQLLSDGTDATITGLCPGDYQIRIEDELGCLSEPFDFVYLSRSPQMLPEFEIIDTASCNNNTSDGRMAVNVQMGYFDQVSPTLVTEAITYSYRWDGNPALSNDTLTQVLGGTHSVRITDNLGCQNTFTSFMPSKTVIWIDDAYIVSSQLQEDYFCPGDTVQLFASVVEPDSILWSNSDYIIGDSTGPMVKVLAATNKIFYVTAYNNNCYDEDTIIVGRYVIEPLIASVDGDSIVAAGSEVKLFANSPVVSYAKDEEFTTTHSYTWASDFAGATWLPAPPDTIAPTLIAGETGIITVYDTIKIFNPSYSNQVCLVSDTLNLKVLSSVEASSGFTPNGDGNFDTWDISGINGWAEVEVQIFNRWGGLIWEHSGAYDGDNKWDGTNAKGNPVPSGTYYYVITYGNNQGVSKTLTGPVTILR